MGSKFPVVSFYKGGMVGGGDRLESWGLSHGIDFQIRLPY